jgi:chromate transport protein ChrA
LIAGVYILAGVYVCFCGCKLIAGLNFIVPSILSLMVIIIMLSALGFDSVLEEDNETTLTGIIKAILGIAICIFIEYKAC